EATTQTAWASFSYNWVEGVQVLALGAQAEYGQFTRVGGSYASDPEATGSALVKPAADRGTPARRSAALSGRTARGSSSATITPTLRAGPRSTTVLVRPSRPTRTPCSS